jgi:hemerythrin-like domain-containing protein
MKTYSIIKRLYGEEINQVNAEIYNTKKDAKNAGNLWERDYSIYAELRKGRNFEVIEN